MKTRINYFVKTSSLLMPAVLLWQVGSMGAATTNVVTTAVTRGGRTNSTAVAVTNAAPASTAGAAAGGPPPIPATTTPARAGVAGAKGAPKGGDDEIALNVKDMPLAQVLDLYSELVGRTILRSTTLPMTTAITVQSRGLLPKAEAITALETVMAMNGFTVVPVGDKFVKVIPGAEAGTAGGEFSTTPPSELPVSGRFITQIVQLKYVPVQDAVNAISPFASNKTGASIIPIAASQTIVLRDYSENIKRMMEVIEKIDDLTPLNVKPEVIPIKYALASDIAQVLGSLTASGPGVSVGRSSTGRLSATGSSGSTTSTGTTGTGYPGTTPTTTGTASPSGSSRSSFQNRLQSIVNRAASSGDFQILGEAKIIADERTNSLLIFANDQDMIMIKDIISRLDVVLSQVLIEAIIMEVSLNDGKDIGVSYLQQPKKLGGDVTTAGGVVNPVGQQAFLNPVIANLLGGTTNSSGPIVGSSLPGGFSYFGKIGDSFSVALTAAATDSRVNVLSRPTIQTSHAVEARLFIGDTVPYVTGTYFGGTVNGSSSQYQQKEIGITMNVLPLINPDGLVVMDISQNIEQLGTSVRIDQNDVPTTTKREALAKVAVRDRETIVLGGFISTTKSKSNSGVPYLKDIPGLGFLFRSHSDSMKRVELMVFLRPTVLPTPEAAAVVASDERDKLPGVKRAEFEIREEERKRNEEVEAEMRRKLGLKEPPAKKTQ